MFEDTLELVCNDPLGCDVWGDFCIWFLMIPLGYGVRGDLEFGVWCSSLDTMFEDMLKLLCNDPLWMRCARIFLHIACMVEPLQSWCQGQYKVLQSQPTRTQQQKRTTRYGVWWGLCNVGARAHTIYWNANKQKQHKQGREDSVHGGVSLQYWCQGQYNLFI